MVSHSPIIPINPDMEEKKLSSINSLEDLSGRLKCSTSELSTRCCHILSSNEHASKLRS
jgi:hypothetical protein